MCSSPADQLAGVTAEVETLADLDVAGLTVGQLQQLTADSERLAARLHPHRSRWAGP